MSSPSEGSAQCPAPRAGGGDFRGALSSPLEPPRPRTPPPKRVEVAASRRAPWEEPPRSASPTTGSQEGQPHPDHGSRFLEKGGQTSGYSHLEARGLGAPRRGSGLGLCLWGPHGTRGSPTSFLRASHSWGPQWDRTAACHPPTLPRAASPGPRVTRLHLFLPPQTKLGSEYWPSWEGQLGVPVQPLWNPLGTRSRRRQSEAVRWNPVLCPR